MAIKNINPQHRDSDSRRSLPTFDELTPKSKPEKSLLKPMKKSGGRNNTGKMTMRYMGGGHKKEVSCDRFQADKDGMEAL
jgi:large subunit ribosomal protein L2